MGYQDFREYLAELERRGKLHRIGVEEDPLLARHGGNLTEKGVALARIWFLPFGAGPS